jgi:hypothetical protein
MNVAENGYPAAGRFTGATAINRGKSFPGQISGQFSSHVSVNPAPLPRILTGNIFFMMAGIFPVSRDFTEDSGTRPGTRPLHRGNYDEGYSRPMDAVPPTRKKPVRHGQQGPTHLYSRIARNIPARILFPHCYHGLPREQL